MGKEPSRQLIYGRDGSHHLDRILEYCSVREAEAAMEVIKANPSKRKSKKKPRKRDLDRLDFKVRNPYHTSSSPCIVCKFHFKRQRLTAKYCRECIIDPRWGKRVTRATGWQKAFHPRLCSPECSDIFHKTEIRGLDFATTKRRTRKKYKYPGSESDDEENTPDRSRRR